tara:strand:- start:2060 stop:2275 length:216 start_codon:yes stop_codon:yes gene_type:complete
MLSRREMAMVLRLNSPETLAPQAILVSGWTGFWESGEAAAAGVGEAAVAAVSAEAAIQRGSHENSDVKIES